MFQTLRLKLALLLLPVEYTVIETRDAWKVRDYVKVRSLSERVKHVATDHLRAGSHIRKRFTKLADELIRVICTSGSVTL